MEELRVELRGTSELAGTGKQANKQFLLMSVTEESEHLKRVQAEREAFLEDYEAKSPSAKMNDHGEFSFTILQKQSTQICLLDESCRGGS